MIESNPTDPQYLDPGKQEDVIPMDADTKVVQVVDFVVFQGAIVQQEPNPTFVAAQT